VLVFGGPADLRSSSVPFVRALSGPRRIPAVVVALLVPLPFLLATSSFLAPLVVLAVPLIGLGALRISAVTFGGIGGDIVGATGEVCRALVLVALSAMI
jgi:cobalamin synthase